MGSVFASSENFQASQLVELYPTEFLATVFLVTGEELKTRAAAAFTVLTRISECLVTVAQRVANRKKVSCRDIPCIGTVVAPFIAERLSQVSHLKRRELAVEHRTVGESRRCRREADRALRTRHRCFSKVRQQFYPTFRLFLSLCETLRIAPCLAQFDNSFYSSVDETLASLSRLSALTPDFIQKAFDVLNVKDEDTSKKSSPRFVFASFVYIQSLLKVEQ